MKTTTKLAFALVGLGIIAVLVGAFGVYGIEKTIQAEEGQSAAYYRSSSQVKQIELQFEELRLSLSKASFTSARLDTARLDRQTSSLVSGIDRGLADMRSDLGSDSSLDAYAALVSAWYDYRPLIVSASFEAFEGQSSTRVEAGFATLSQKLELDAAELAKADRAAAKAASRTIVGMTALGLIASIAAALFLCRGLARRLGGDPEELRKRATDLAAGYIAPASGVEAEEGAQGALSSATERISAVFRATRSLTNAVSATSRQLSVAAMGVARNADWSKLEEAVWIEDIAKSSRQLTAQAAELRDAIAYFSFSPKPVRPDPSPAPAALPFEELVEPAGESSKAMTAAIERMETVLRYRSAWKPRRGLYLLPHAKVESMRGSTSIKAFRPDPPKLRLLKAGE